jgi:DNA polymerase-2
MAEVSGWLFDVYPGEHGLTLWIIDRDGRKHTCSRPFTPSFILHLNERDARRAEILSRRAPAPTSITRTSKTELYSGDTLDVLEVHVQNTMLFRNVVLFFEKFFPHHAFYNSDIPVEQQFLYATGLFPLALCEFEITNGQLLGWQLKDNRNAVEYELPPLAIMFLRHPDDFVPPKYQKRLTLEVRYDGKSYVLEHQDDLSTLESLHWHLHRCDPDILLTEYGDATLLPQIVRCAQRLKYPLPLNRDGNAGYRTARASSFVQYGKVVHTEGAFELAGRWHIDARNSMTLAEADLDGLWEMVRMTQMPGQRQSRASIGTSMSSMQLSWAVQNNILIPSKKREPEEFKSGYTLLLADRGGLTYTPPLGYHEQIAELDFASMYPSIMVNNNISPETVNCRCCRNTRVPELAYTICERRLGLVPATLKAVIEKRAYYKRKKKEYKGHNEALYRKYHGRQNALKWMLVSCFGYLGYKNARFGRIEAHEAVNAYSREILLTAKEIAEARGFTLVHGIIDCLWLKKPGADERAYDALCREIHARVGIEISLEGIYDWILFPASKQYPDTTTATRYVGWYRHGELKARGIELRRRDTPELIKNMQAAVLETMSLARNVQELKHLLPELLEIARGYVALLKQGKANPRDLVMRRHITKDPGEYTNNRVSAVVSALIQQLGVSLSAGECIEFIMIDQSGKNRPEKAKPLALYAFEDGYDIEKYCELALKALETLLEPFGYSYEKLQDVFGLSKKRMTKPTQSIQTSLFEEETTA